MQLQNVMCNLCMPLTSTNVKFLSSQRGMGHCQPSCPRYIWSPRSCREVPSKKLGFHCCRNGQCFIVCGLSSNLLKHGGKVEQSVMQLYIVHKEECCQSSPCSRWLQYLHCTEDNSVVLKYLPIHLLATACQSIPANVVPNLEQGIAKRKRSVTD